MAEYGTATYGQSVYGYPVHPDNLSLAARRLYEQWKHLEVDGEAEGWPWATLAAACARPIDDLYDLLAGAQHPWAPAFDPQLALETLRAGFAEALVAWLGQFAGVPNREDLPPAGQRWRLTETAGARRGSAEAIIAAAQQRAIGPDGTPGSARVLLVERISGDPYHFAITMTASEVPDPAATRRDIAEQTPAGRRGTNPAERFDFNLTAGGDFDTLEANWATFNAARDAFTDFNDMAARPSGV